MILGTQWYILFNVIAGASAIPRELRYAGQNLGARLAVVEAVALPAVFPFYVTGAITASGGSWNASDRRRGRELGAAGWRRTARRVHRAGDRGGRFSAHRARHRGDEPVRGDDQPLVLAPALLYAERKFPAGLTRTTMNQTALLDVQGVRKAFPKPGRRRARRARRT